MLKPVFTSFAIAALAACGASPEGDLVRFDVGTEIGAAALVGVSVDPISGDRFVLDAELGIHRQLASGAFEKVWDASRTADYGIELDSAFTDFASLGDGQFALTARNEGFLLDTAADTLDLHFCYVPGDIIIIDPEEQDPEEQDPEEQDPEEQDPEEQDPEEQDPEEQDPLPIIEPQPIEVTPANYEQLTLSLTYDPARDLLYAQPRTISLDGETLMSHVAMFRRSNGYEQAWIDLDDPEFLAGALVNLDEDSLLIARDAEVFWYEIGAKTMQRSRSFSVDGVEQITGLAVDGETLLIADGVRSELIELPLGDL